MKRKIVIDGSVQSVARTPEYGSGSDYAYTVSINGQSEIEERDESGGLIVNHKIELLAPGTIAKFFGPTLLVEKGVRVTIEIDPDAGKARQQS